MTEQTPAERRRWLKREIRCVARDIKCHPRSESVPQWREYLAELERELEGMGG